MEKGNTTLRGIVDAESTVGLIFETDPGQVIKEDIKGEKGIYIIKVLEREPALQKTFDEAKNEVYQALRTQKVRDVQQAMLEELKKKYDVVIHQSAFQKESQTNDKNQ